MTIVLALVLALITPPVKVDPKVVPSQSSVQMDRSKNDMIVNVEYPGGSIPMMLDTGASICMCPINLISKYHIPVVTSFQWLEVQGVAGKTHAIQAYMISMAVGGQVQKIVPIALTEPNTFDMCLLGRSYLDHYIVTLDGSSLTLKVRD